MNSDSNNSPTQLIVRNWIRKDAKQGSTLYDFLLVAGKRLAFKQEELEIANQSWIYLWEKAGNYYNLEDGFSLEKHQSFRGFAFTTAKSAARDLRRKERRYNRNRTLFYACFGSKEDRLPTEDSEKRLDRNNTPEELASKNELTNYLREGISSLPESYKEALSLIYREGLKYSEAAARLNTTEATVKERVYRAKQSLRRLLPPLTL